MKSLNIAQLLNYLFLPRFDDIDAQRKANLIWSVFAILYGLTISALLVVALYAPAVFLFTCIMAGVILILTVVIFALLHHKQINLSSHILCSALSAIFFANAYFNNGIRGHGFSLFFLIIILSGILLNRRGLWIYSSLTIASAVALYLFEKNGIIEVEIAAVSRTIDIFILSTILGCAAGLISATGRTLTVSYNLLLETLERLSKTTVSKKYTDNIIDSMHDMLFVIDQEHRIQTVNQTAVKKLGYSHVDELIGQKFEHFFKEGRLPEWEFQEQDGSLSNVYSTLFTVNREPIDILLSSALIEYQQNSMGVVCVAHDVSLQRKVERAMVTAKQHEEKMEEAKLDLLANMSHELRTPLNGMLGVMTLIEDMEIDEELSEYMEMIQESSQNLMGVVEDILDFTSQSAPDLEAEALSVHELLQAALDEIAIQAKGKGLSVLSEISPLIPPQLLGDRERLSHIFKLLLLNALKFTHEGEIGLRVTLGQVYGDALWLDFSVFDTGIGIPDDEFEKIFEPFYQVDGSSTRQYGGTGMGLAVCKQIVEQMGGSIEVESTLNEGTTMHVRLMLKETSAVAVGPGEITSAV